MELLTFMIMSSILSQVPTLFMINKQAPQPLFSQVTKVQTQNAQTQTMFTNPDWKKWEKQYDSLLAWFNQNKRKIGLASGATILLAALYHAKKLERKVAKQTTWSCWQADKSLEELFEIPQKDLGVVLVLDIQKTYTDSQHFSDFIRPFIDFLDEIEHEIEQLKSYISIISWIHKIPFFKKLFDQNLMVKAQQKVERLAYVKNIFLAWAAEYKLEQSTLIPNENSTN